MTTVGKILVVLHLVLSVLFMAFAGAVYTAQKNWRAVAMTNIAQLAKANAKMKDMDSEFTRERNDNATKITALSGDITKLTGEKAALSNQVATLTADVNNLTLQFDGMKDQANLNVTEAKERSLEATTRLIENTKFLESREELIKKVHEIEDKRFALEIQLQQLNEKHDRVLGDLRVFKLYNGSHGWPTDPRQMVAQTTPPPPLEGVVVDYRKEKKDSTELVEISLGSDDGLSVGHKMTVYNQGRYLGQIRLTRVEADKAVGIVIAKAKNMIIQKGDNVTTKL